MGPSTTCPERLWSLCPLDIQELSGHGSGQPVLGDLGLSGGAAG